MSQHGESKPDKQKRRPVERAAGLVVFRTGAAGQEVLLVHRPALHDWVLPKGHLEAGELAPEAAAREFHEETGYRAVVAAPIATVDYPIPGAIKRVRWFAGRLSAPAPDAQPDPDEVDAAVWCEVGQALETMTYANERQVMQQAAQMPPTCQLLVVRHAKALGRKSWKKDDWLRPLAARGRRQAKQLTHLLGAYGVGGLASSSSERCLETLQPFAAKRGIAVEEIAALSEEAALRHPAGVKQAMRALRARLLKTGAPLAVCGHRPVLPAMVEVLKPATIGAEYTTLRPGEVLVAYLDANSGALTAVECYPSKL